MSICMAIVMYIHISMQEEDNLEHIDAMCHLCTL